MNYQKIYNAIIQKARSENRIKSKDTYYEAHHIIPKCLGGTGTYKQWKTHSNIILLTAREHFVCHLLLCEIYPENKNIQYACWLMCMKKNKKVKSEYKISSRVYERLRVEHSKRTSEDQRGKIVSQETRDKISQSNKGKETWNKGIPQTKEYIDKLKDSIRGRKSNRKGSTHTQESKEKMGNASLGNKNWLGKKHSEDTKEKMRQSKVGKKLSEETKEKLRNKIPWNKGKNKLTLEIKDKN